MLKRTSIILRQVASPYKNTSTEVPFYYKPVLALKIS